MYRGNRDGVDKVVEFLGRKFSTSAEGVVPKETIIGRSYYKGLERCGAHSNDVLDECLINWVFVGAVNWKVGIAQVLAPTVLCMNLF